MANGLAGESSPYLLQHAGNPVDWLPWGPAALERAVSEERPILLSIGYSSCHWCHVMERESFEDAATAALMNESFICIKVDREERPDIDALYMEAVQGMTGHGGWPLTVFLTPEQVPFFGGTYYPPEPRHGMPAFSQVLQAIAAAWESDRENIRSEGRRLGGALAGAARLEASTEPYGQQDIDRAVATIAASSDNRWGGFGSAPKFPQTPVLELLLLRGEQELALRALRGMAAGGIHDQLGGGFSRYSVDASWTVPHFEKMLYDNALLARAYLHGWQVSGELPMLQVAVDILQWALREMRGPEGGFYSALDADSEGVEGRFYVWRLDELEQLLGADAPAAAAWLGVTATGNFEDPHHPEPGLNVLSARGPRPPAEEARSIRERLLAARAERVRPALDDKRLTSWNALMVSALAEVGAALSAAGAPAVEGGDGEQLSAAAQTCAEFLLSVMRDERGRLLRTYRSGQARIPAYLEDHAYLLEALLVMFETSCQERWLAQAEALATTIIALFADEERGGFFSTAADGEQLIARRKEIDDSPIPAGSSSAALGLLRLYQLTGEQRLLEHSRSAIALVSEIAPRHPSAFGHVLQAMHWQLAPARPVACAVPGTAPLSEA